MRQVPTRSIVLGGEQCEFRGQGSPRAGSIRSSVGNCRCEQSRRRYADMAASMALTITGATYGPETTSITMAEGPLE